MAPRKLSRAANQSRSKRAGLTFPVGRVLRELKIKYLRKMFRCSAGAGVYAAAIFEYLVAEIAELSGNEAIIERKKRIQPRHVMLAVAKDQEMHTFLQHVIIPGAGVVPLIHRALVLPKHKKAAKAKKPTTTRRPKAVATTSTVKRAKAPTAKVPTKPTAPSAKPAAPPRRVSIKAGDIVILSEKALHLGQKLTVIKCDITKVAVDAVVHPTNSSLYTGGQIGQTLASRGGAAFLNEINKVKASGNLADDGVLLTPAFNINASHVLHCNGPAWNANNCVPRLSTTVRNILQKADEQDFRSIAIPSIGSGRAGWPKQTAAETILRAIHGYFQSSAQSSIRQIYFVLYDKESIDVYTSELEKLVA